MRQQFIKKGLSLVLVVCLFFGTVTSLTGCGQAEKKPVTLTVFSQLANYSGEQTGWVAKILLDKFNVKLNIIADVDNEYQTRAENQDLGDIVVWGKDSEQYVQAFKSGLLYGWEDDDLLNQYGSYIKNHMKKALQKNQDVTLTATEGKDHKIYGIGNNIATDHGDHESFIYTWDIRWDLYKKLGYPKVKDWNDFKDLLIQMQKVEPIGEDGKQKYAVSLWPDWDDNMVMYVKSTATAYFGYDELGMGLYDPVTGKYHGALEADGPYLESLKFYHDLYQAGLVDPDSRTQTYQQMQEKVSNSQTLFSIFNYAGERVYNTDIHTGSGKIMLSMKPTKASPIVYGQNVQGGNHVWSIGAKTNYPELCMEIINYLATPEGRMVMTYGPKDTCWYYKNGKTYFTELGKRCQTDENTIMKDGYSGTFKSGQLQINNTTWSLDATNPDTDGETYNSVDWASNQKEPGSDILKDWQDITNCKSIDQYMEDGNYTIAPASDYIESVKSDELTLLWKKVAACIVSQSWKAIYAKTDKEYQACVDKMIKEAEGYGYQDCLEWSQNEAALRYVEEQEITK